MMRNRFYLPMFKEYEVAGQAAHVTSCTADTCLLLPPWSIIYYDLNGRESLSLLSALFTSLAAVFCLAFMFIITLPSMGYRCFTV